MRISSSDDARTTWAAAAGCQEGTIEANAVVGEKVDIGCSGRRVPVAAEVVPADVISDEDDDVRRFGFDCCRRQEQARKDKDHRGDESHNAPFRKQRL